MNGYGCSMTVARLLLPLKAAVLLHIEEQPIGNMIKIIDLKYFQH